MPRSTLPSRGSTSTDYLRATRAHTAYPGLAFAVDASTERVVVRISAPLDLPILVPGVDARTRISATGASYVVVSE